MRVRRKSLKPFNAKQLVHRILEQLPDDCSIEDVQYHLTVAERIRSRLESVCEDSLIAQSEVEKRLAKYVFP